VSLFSSSNGRYLQHNPQGGKHRSCEAMSAAMKQLPVQVVIAGVAIQEGTYSVCCPSQQAHTTSHMWPPELHTVQGWDPLLMLPAWCARPTQQLHQKNQLHQENPTNNAAVPAHRESPSCTRQCPLLSVARPKSPSLKPTGPPEGSRTAAGHQHEASQKTVIGQHVGNKSSHFQSLSLPAGPPASLPATTNSTHPHHPAQQH
jgi:hypothetical protein